MLMERNHRETVERKPAGEEVIAACRRGDPDAFAVLFEAHKDRVFSIALRYSGDEAAAMDIAQDIFLKLISKIGDFRGDSRFESWLYRLVVNRCLDYRRGRRRWLPVVDDMLDALSSTRESALHGLLRAEAQENVWQVVGKLPAAQRIVVVLRYTEGLSYEEIAELLGCSTGTVASRLNRAHKFLERRLANLRRGRENA
jgi:RNA polymerase sigma-70 factor (ECF subfamily)